MLVKGAQQAGLKPEYVQKLARTPTYKPDATTLAARSTVPARESLPTWTDERLAHYGTDGSDCCYVAVLGLVMYVPKQKVFFGSHKGRDITAR